MCLRHVRICARFRYPIAAETIAALSNRVIPLDVICSLARHRNAFVADSSFRFVVLTRLRRLHRNDGRAFQPEFSQSRI